MRLQVEFNGTEKELIELCDELAKDGTEFGLDSLDLGDAMGYIITETQNQGGEFTHHKGNLTLNAAIEYDAFSWKVDWKTD